MKKKILLTNDDGIYAAGLTALESALDFDKNSCFIAAPLHEKSGSSHSITLERPLRIKKFSDFKYSVDGTPVDSVFVGLNNLSKEKPDLVISGINKGANLGNDIAYSGTVAAAIEAWWNNITSLAVSLFISDPSSFSETLFQKAAELLFSQIIPEIEQKVGKETFYNTPHLFNINIPDTSLDNIKSGIKWTFPGQRNYGGNVVKRTDPRGREYFWIGGDQHQFANIPGSDCNAVREGYISISPLKLSFGDKEALRIYAGN